MKLYKQKCEQRKKREEQIAAKELADQAFQPQLEAAKQAINGSNCSTDKKGAIINCISYLEEKQVGAEELNEQLKQTTTDLDEIWEILSTEQQQEIKNNGLYYKQNQ
jgi:hypothetical protein